MKPHPRIRKTVKWGGGVMSLGLLVLWVCTATGGKVYHNATGYGVGVAFGGIQFDTPGANLFVTGASHRFRVTDGVQWRDVVPHRDGGVGSGFTYHLPLWIPLSMFAALAWFAWKGELTRERQGGLCPVCRYSRNGLAAHAPCPECGTRPTLPASS